jgi:hypothetical protein
MRPFISIAARLGFLLRRGVERGGLAVSRVFREEKSKVAV